MDYLMIDFSKSLSKDVKIINSLGMHARPAAQIASLAGKAVSGVWMISEDGQKADAKDTLDIISLYCPKGSTITFLIENSLDIETLEAIIALVENGFGENYP